MPGGNPASLEQGWVRAAIAGVAVLALAGCAQPPPAAEAGPTIPPHPNVAVVEVPGALPTVKTSDCASNPLLKSATRKTTTEPVKTEAKYQFYDRLPVQIATGLDSLRVEGSSLVITTASRGRFAQYQGPITDVLEVTRYEGSPGVALLAHTLTAGLMFALTPINSTQHAFGCISRRPLKREVYGRESAPTGQLQWQEAAANFTLRVEGLGRARELSFNYAPQSDRSVKIDLFDAIMDGPGDGMATLRVTCLNCRAAPTAARPELGEMRQQMTLQADFRRVRAAELAKREQLAKEAREREEQAAQAEAKRRQQERKAAFRRDERRMGQVLNAPVLAAMPWRARLDFFVQQELTQWLSPPADGLEEVPAPVYPAALFIKQQPWETNDEFEQRVNRARLERRGIIEKIQSDYRNKVEERNRRVELYNTTQAERQGLLNERRRDLIEFAIRTLAPPVALSELALDQQSGALTMAAEVEGLGRQTFAFSRTTQAFRRAALTSPQSLRARPDFEINDNGEIFLKTITVEAGGGSFSGGPAAGAMPAVQGSSVTIAQVSTPPMVQQGLLTVDRNQVEQILYREENELLRRRLDEQRQKQELALAAEQARAAAEIAKLRAEAQALRERPPTPQQTSGRATINEAHALVIGISAYPGNNRLANPVNDARVMAEKLRGLGFKVTEITDVNREQMVRGLSQFSQSAAKADLSVLFYAGHGVQLSGTNYMVPIDMSLRDPAQAPLQGVSLTQVVETYLPGKAKLVFLDACRDNPLMASSVRGISRGLAPINVSEGTLISYATKDGQTAEDGAGQPNSPFTQALLEHIGDPADIAVVLRKVREKVMNATGGKQQPWEYGSLTGGELVLSAIRPAKN
jgi:hypothetical protein